MAIHVSELSIKKAITISQAFFRVFKVIGWPYHENFLFTFNLNPLVYLVLDKSVVILRFGQMFKEVRTVSTNIPCFLDYYWLMGRFFIALRGTAYIIAFYKNVFNYLIFKEKSGISITTKINSQQVQRAASVSKLVILQLDYFLRNDVDKLNHKLA